MSVFFKLKSSQNRLLPLLCLAMIFLASCASHRKAKVQEAKIDKVIATARSYTGTPYKYGGTTRAGMDCSGLLLNAFRAIDFTLPRTSEAQSKLGREVKLQEVKPGDLVFFATGKKKRKITHVGLVTEKKAKDNIKFIHASSSLGVIEANLLADYYKKSFRLARRIIEP